MSMSSAEILEAAKTLPMVERIELARELCDDRAGGDFDPELTPEQISELDRRAEEALKNSSSGIPIHPSSAR